MLVLMSFVSKENGGLLRTNPELLGFEISIYKIISITHWVVLGDFITFTGISSSLVTNIISLYYISERGI